MTSSSSSYRHVAPGRYEALRAYYVERLPLAVARRFGVGYGTACNWVGQFVRNGMPNSAPLLFSSTGTPGHVAGGRRGTGHSGGRCRSVDLGTGPSPARTRHAGLLLFWPLLARRRFDQLVDQAQHPGTKMVPAASALLSLLVLKLLDKERLSHIDDFNCDEALGLFAGLNILPKKSFATDYSYRTTRDHQIQLLKGWVNRASLVPPRPTCFRFDFHAIGHRGEETDLENHYQPLRGHRPERKRSSRWSKSRVFCWRQCESYARSTSR